MERARLLRQVLTSQARRANLRGSDSRWHSRSAFGIFDTRLGGFSIFWKKKKKEKKRTSRTVGTLMRETMKEQEIRSISPGSQTKEIAIEDQRYEVHRVWRCRAMLQSLTSDAKIWDNWGFVSTKFSILDEYCNSSVFFQNFHNFAPVIATYRQSLRSVFVTGWKSLSVTIVDEFYIYDLTEMKSQNLILTLNFKVKKKKFLSPRG